MKVFSLSTFIVIAALVISTTPSFASLIEENEYTSIESIEALVRQVDSLSQARQLDTALVIGRKAVKAAELTVGENDSLYADALSALGKVYYYLGKPAACDSTWLRSLKIRRAVLGSNHLSVATNVNNLGNLRVLQGKFNEAKGYFEEALSIRLSLLDRESVDVATSMHSLATVYFYQSDYTVAESLNVEALRIKEKKLGEDHLEVALILANLGSVHMMLAKFSEAEKDLRRSLQIKRAKHPPGHPDIAQTLNNLAILYLETGKYSKAEPILREAITICQNALGERHPQVAIVMNNLANLKHKSGQNDDAEKIYRHIIDILAATYGAKHIEVARVQTNLANLYREQREYEKAESLYVQAKNIGEMVYDKEHYFNAWILTNYGELFAQQGKYAAAENCFRKAMDIARVVIGPEHPDYAEILSHLGNMYFMMGNYSESQALYRKVLDINQSLLGREHPTVAACLGRLARNEIADGHLDEGLSLFLKQQESRHSFISQVFTNSSEDQKVKYIEQYPLIDDAFLTFACQHAEGDALERSFEMVLQGKSSVIDAVSHEKEIIVRSVDENVLNVLDSLKVVNNEIASLVYAGVDKISSEVYKTRLASLYSKKNSIEATISQKQTKDLSLIGEPEWDINDIAVALPENAVLVEIIQYDPYNFEVNGSDSERKGKPRYAVYTLSSAGGLILSNLGEAEKIDLLAKEIRENLAEGRGFLGTHLLKNHTNRLRERLATLFNQLIQPIEEELEGVEDIYISPDGQLNLLPFEILVNEAGEYLIEKYNISYISSGRDILRFGKERERGHGALVVADPVFDLAGEDLVAVRDQVSGISQGDGYTMRGNRGVSECLAEEFTRLPSTRKEGEMVRRALEDVGIDGVQYYAGERALEEVVKGYSGAPRVMHIATHGYFCEDMEMRGGRIVENPLLRCGLALAGANRVVTGEPVEDGEDGILTAFEVSGLDLMGTELAVLSACETGVGEVKNGEGVYGLRRVFQYAGAKTMLMSLWKIPDEETVELMERFYKGWLSGKRKKDALRESILGMIAEERVRYGVAHPLLWGGFVLVGDPN